ncbi:MAG: 50S ribosomal protein L29 [Deltaproteobacteria bacterium]|nr:MAG: 50S ribosomal protein L29 [Deltaproteobacteria bacterium]
MSFAELSDEQLVHKILETERELVRAQFAHSQQQLENTAILGNLRKAVARLKTETRTRETAAGLRKNALIDQHAKSFAPVTDSSDAGAQEKGGFLSGIVDKLQGND